jgi:hypothetical protein
MKTWQILTKAPVTAKESADACYTHTCIMTRVGSQASMQAKNMRYKSYDGKTTKQNHPHWSLYVRPFFLLVGLRDRRRWNSRFQKKNKIGIGFFFFLFFVVFFPRQSCAWKYNFIALALFMKRNSTITLCREKLNYTTMVLTWSPLAVKFKSNMVEDFSVENREFPQHHGLVMNYESRIWILDS